MSLKLKIVLICLVSALGQAAQEQEDIFSFSSQYLSGHVDEHQMIEYLKSKKNIGLSEEEKFLIIDTLNKKPPEESNIITLVESISSPLKISSSQKANDVTQLNQVHKTTLSESRPWVWKIALTVVVGVFVINSSGKKLIVDSNPFN